MLIFCARPQPSTPSLGVTSIATFLLTKEREVRIFDDAPYMLDIKDENNDPREKIGGVIPRDDSLLYRLPHFQRFEDLLRVVREFEADVVGVSVTEAAFGNGIMSTSLKNISCP